MSKVLINTVLNKFGKTLKKRNIKRAILIIDVNPDGSIKPVKTVGLTPSGEEKELFEKEKNEKQ